MSSSGDVSTWALFTHTECVCVRGVGGGAANRMYPLLSRDEEWIRGHLWLGWNLDQDHGPPAIMNVTRSSRGGGEGVGLNVPAAGSGGRLQLTQLVRAGVKSSSR